MGVRHGDGEDAAQRGAAGDDADAGVERLDLRAHESDVVDLRLQVPGPHDRAVEDARLAGAAGDPLVARRVAVDVEAAPREVLGDRGARGVVGVALLVEGEGAAERRQEKDRAARLAVVAAMAFPAAREQAHHLEAVERVAPRPHGVLRAHEAAAAGHRGAGDLVGAGRRRGAGRERDGEGEREDEGSGFHRGTSLREKGGRR